MVAQFSGYIKELVAEELWFDFRKGKIIFSTYKVSRPALDPPYLLSNEHRKRFPWRLADRGVDLTFTRSVEFHKEWAYTSAIYTPIFRRVRKIAKSDY